MDQDLLLLLLLYLRKVYNNLEWGRLLKTLIGYGAGIKIRGFLAKIWLRKEVVTRQNGFRVPQFRATRGMTQGGIVSPILFNVTVHSVVCHWISRTLEDESDYHEGL